MRTRLQTIKAITSTRFQGSYIQELFDPVQTHAIYGVSKSRMNEAKDMLKKHGAKRFRIVNPRAAKDLVIICFKLP